MTTNLHAHVDRYAVDCDGPVYHDYVMTLNDAEKAEHEKAQGVNDFHDIHFKDRVLTSQVAFHPLNEIVVSITEDGFEVAEQTDEGCSNASVRWCEDEYCDPDARGQRDVYAEQMGY